MITINGKVYRNLQEQVGKNQEDIEDLQDAVSNKQDTLTAGDGINITNNIISVDDTKVIVKDSYGNVDEVLKVAQLQSETGEDDDCKAKIYLSSGSRRSRVTLESQGEEAGSSIILQGTTSIGSEGTVEIAGETNFTTNSRITVTDGNGDVEEIAYLSDIPTYTAGTNVTIQDNVISVEQLSDENEEYACSLIVNPDSVVLNYTEYDEEHIGETTSYDLLSTAINTNNLINRHLYEHNIYLDVKGHDGGVLKDDFTGTVILTYITNNATQYNTTTIYTLLNNLQSHGATGYMKYDTNQKMYVVYGIRGRSDGESIDVLASYGDYTPAGSTENKCIVTFVSDRVRTLF